ncbi:MAG: DUF2383 domain-containing protein [Chitinophagaceae bacterium]|nr:DUF2383 domain-containing protein [Chitinophagaceae bacterium]
MLKSTSCKVPVYIVQKLLYLLAALKNERDQYSQAAAKISNRQLRDNINLLAQENNQYASELLSQIRILGVENVSNDNMIQDQDAHTQVLDDVKGDGTQSTIEILQICRDSEKKMIRVYREVLNEPHLMEDIRRLIRCQLNGIMYAFLRLKLFSSTI